MKNRSISTDRPPEAADPLRFLDGLRGLAALYVVLFHVNEMLWEGFSHYLTHPQNYSLPGQILAYFSLLFNYGHQAVLLFFILSGFVIHLRYARQAQTKHARMNQFDAGPFFWRRFKRIYPPLLWAIVLTYILDHSASVTALNYDPLAPRLISTLLLLPNPTPEWGSNLTLWSLRVEWWIYLLYPLIWWINRHAIWKATGIIGLLFAFSLIPMNLPADLLLMQHWLQIAQTIFAYLIVWWLGALLAEIYVGRIRIKFGWLSLLTIVLIVLLIPQFNPVPLLAGYPQIQIVFWGLGLTGLFAAMFAWKNRGGSLGWLERLKPLGDMSYTLYITHWPIIAWFSAVILAHSSTGTLPSGYEWIIPGIVVCLGSAYLTHFLVEKPFQRRRMPRPELPVLNSIEL